MAKKEKPLSPEELSQYKPEDPLPKLQAEFSLDLNSTFQRAAHDGAVVIGSGKTELEILPKMTAK